MLIPVRRMIKKTHILTIKPFTVILLPRLFMSQLTVSTAQLYSVCNVKKGGVVTGLITQISPLTKSLAVFYIWFEAGCAICRDDLFIHNE